LNYKSIIKNIKNPTKFKFSLCILVLTLIFYTSIRAYSSTINTSNKTNTFYTNIINYTLPIVNVTSSKATNVVAETPFSLEKMALGFFGISLNDPYSIMGREVSYLRGASLQNSENGEGNQGTIANSDPFKNVGNSGAKLSPQTAKAQNIQEKNIPNKKVVIYDPALKNRIMPSKPEVLLYHSHNTEAYGINGVTDTKDSAENVTGVGDVLANTLEKDYGISIINDHKIHNTIYNDSYLSSGLDLAHYLKIYGNFKLIIDMHRDQSFSRLPVITKINGKTVARYEFVMCKGNPHFAQNMIVVNKLISISQKLFPGLLRDGPEETGAFFYNEGIQFYNQEQSNNAMLIEIGSNLNTPAEAQATAKCLARIIAVYLNEK